MTKTLLWLRRDLRIDDNRALLAAIRRGAPIIAAFIFDDNILRPLPREDRRITFICQALTELQASLAKLGIPLIHRRGRPTLLIPALAAQYDADAVVCSEDYEPDAIQRDLIVQQTLQSDGRTLQAAADQVIFAKRAILTQKGESYGVFTPYKRAWLQAFAARPQSPEALEYQQPLPFAPEPIPNAAALGFTEYRDQPAGGAQAADALLADFLGRIARYAAERDYPALPAASGLSPYLRFGCISIRRLAAAAMAQRGEGSDTWLSELIWREFYQQHLYHYPDNVRQSWKAAYRDLPWENRADFLAAWQCGETGYPIVDAAMRCLAATGTMHNRLRMIAASFLCKDLLCDWRLGEAWFARHLLDFDLAANNGGWQWAASTGCDAQPYFRIFNPETQSKKFDPEGKFIRQWLPELAHLPDKALHAPPQELCGRYPAPIVEHKTQRLKAIAMYQQTAEAYRYFSDTAL